MKFVKIGVVLAATAGVGYLVYKGVQKVREELCGIPHKGDFDNFECECGCCDNVDTECHCDAECTCECHDTCECSEEHDAESKEDAAEEASTEEKKPEAE